MRPRLAHKLALLPLSLALACGAGATAKGPEAPQAGASGGPPVSAAATAQVPWVQMNKGQRIDYMINVMLPKMKAEFHAFDPKRFAHVDCATCHGPGVEDGTFALPNPRLPKLLEPDLFAKHRAATPEVTKFMLERVEPDVADILGVPGFDPATRRGLSCYNCHPREIEPGKPVPPPAEHH